MYSVVVVGCGTYHTAASPRRKPVQAKFENLPAKTSDSPLKTHTKKGKFCKQAVNQHTHLLSLLLPYNTSLAAEAHRTARGSQPDRWSSQHTLAVGGFFEHKAGAHTYVAFLGRWKFVSTRALEEPTSHSNNSQRLNTRLIRPVSCEYLLV